MTLAYRKKSETVEAWQWNGQHELEWPDWLGPLTFPIRNGLEHGWYFIRQPDCDRPYIRTKDDFEREFEPIAELANAPTSAPPDDGPLVTVDPAPHAARAAVITGKSYEATFVPPRPAPPDEMRAMVEARKGALEEAAVLADDLVKEYERDAMRFSKALAITRADQGAVTAARLARLIRARIDAALTGDGK